MSANPTESRDSSRPSTPFASDGPNRSSQADRSADLAAGLAVRSALLRLPGQPFGEPGRRWVQFDEPHESILAWELSEVPAAIARVEAAASEGNWVVGMVSYDAAPAFDKALRSQRHAKVPLVAFGVFASGRASRGPAGGRFTVSDWLAGVGRGDYETSVAEIREAIAAGETYQVNYTMRLCAEFSGDPLGLFAALARAQRADYLCYLDLGGAAVCSASPELLFSKDGPTLVSRPMKGTRPRHPDPATDAGLIADLRSSPKDLAENTMIVDMTRNDLGRIATVGSLQVPALHSIETYPTVHQMTSTVTAQSRASLVEIFAALFPGASITGAPKVATSGIVADMERSPRGAYTGSIGAVGPDGFAEFNIAIRTVWIDQSTGSAEYGTGGGIVWDSNPADEWKEAQHKAQVLHRACSDFALFETIKYEPGPGLTLVERHLDRLASSAEHFGFDLDLVEVRRVLDAVDLEGAARIRLTVSATGGIDLDIAPLNSGSSVTGPDERWNLPIDTMAVDRSDERLYHKTTDRSRYTQARERFPAAPDVILWNERGEVTETTIGNLVVEIEGRWVTPSTESGLLAGTFRAELIDQGVIEPGRVTLAELAGATRIWMINSVRGWIPVSLESSELVTAALNERDC